MKILSDDHLVLNFVKENNYSNAAKRLFEIQNEEWPMLKTGVQSLTTIKSKPFQFDGLKNKCAI